MLPFNKRRSHGATSRRQLPRQRPPRFDRWLNRSVDVAVILALLVGGAALVVHLL